MSSKEPTVLDRKNGFWEAYYILGNKGVDVFIKSLRTGESKWMCTVSSVEAAKKKIEQLDSMIVNWCKCELGRLKENDKN